MLVHMKEGSKVAASVFMAKEAEVAASREQEAWCGIELEAKIVKILYDR